MMVNNPTKMSINFAPYLHKKKRDISLLNMVLFYDLVIILLTKFCTTAENWFLKGAGT